MESPILREIIDHPDLLDQPDNERKVSELPDREYMEAWRHYIRSRAQSACRPTRARGLTRTYR